MYVCSMTSVLRFQIKLREVVTLPQRSQGSRVVIIALALMLGLSLQGLAKTSIVHWQHTSPARDTMVNLLAHEYMQAHPDVEIEVETFPLADFLDKLTVSLAAGVGPDTVQVRSTWVSWLAQSGALQPLSSKLITADELEREFIPGGIAPMKLDGQYFALPTDTQTIVLFYQPHLFEEAGLDSGKPPQTWDELVRSGRKIHRRDAENVTQVMGVATGGYAPVLLSLMAQAGATLWDENTSLPVFNTPEVATGFRFATDLVTEHGIEDRAFGSRWTAFRNEKLAMVYAHPAMRGSFLRTHPDLQFRIVEIPAPVEDGSQAGLVTTWALGVTRKADVDAATSWLMYHQSAESQERWLEETGELPTRWQVIKQPKFQRDPDTRHIMYSLTRAVGVPWMSDAIVDSLVGGAWRKVTNLEASPEAALQDLHLQACVEEERVRSERIK
jgi:multiple sugar transport system substrate-binding protein